MHNVDTIMIALDIVRCFVVGMARRVTNVNEEVTARVADVVSGDANKSKRV